MEKITFVEAQKISLCILKYIDEFCKNNSISYYIAYGTLLGAVRHKGFIPWDDDIDLIMFREDYEKFISKFNVDNYDHFKCLSFENGTFYLPYSKVVDTRTNVRANNFIELKDNGVAVDIFPLDYISDNLFLCNLTRKKNKLLGTLLRYSLFNNYKELSEKRNDKFPLYLLAKKIGAKRISKVMLSSINRDKKTNHVFSAGAELCRAYGVYSTEVFDTHILLDFEGCKFEAPSGYEMFLRERYGDYMKLPPEDQRVQHEQEAWYK